MEEQAAITIATGDSADAAKAKQDGRLNGFLTFKIKAQLFTIKKEQSGSDASMEESAPRVVVWRSLGRASLHRTLCDMCSGVSISSKMAPFTLEPLRLASCRSQPDRSQFCGGKQEVLRLLFRIHQRGRLSFPSAFAAVGVS